MAKVEAANLWGIASPQAAAAKEKITGKIVGAVSTRDTKYVLLQVGKQTPVEAKIGDVLPIELEPFAGARSSRSTPTASRSRRMVKPT